MNNKQHKQIENVRILAKAEAQKTKRDQVIFESTDKKGGLIYDFRAAKLRKGGLEIVRYSGKVERKVVLRDNEDKKPRAAKRKPKPKSTTKSPK